jgi:hypothetical protein
MTCFLLSTVYLGSNSRLRDLKSQAFEWSPLRVIAPPQSLKAIGRSAFFDCPMLHEISFGDS